MTPGHGSTMSSERPLGMYFLWAFIFLFCLYIVFCWASKDAAALEPMGTESDKSGESDGAYKYHPDPEVKNYFREFRVGDLADESIELFSFVKIDDQLVDPSANATPNSAGYGEYKQAMTDLAIYKTYNSIANNYDKYMDRMMGSHFDAVVLAELTKDAPTAKESRKRIMASFSKDLVKEDANLRLVLVHCAFPTGEAKGEDKANSPISSYFGELIAKYANGKGQLDSTKKAFYEVMKPVALMQYLCDNYEKEEERYKTADGNAGKNDSAIYFLNTMAELLKKLDLEKSNAVHINRKNCLYVFEDDTDDAASEALPLDAVKIYYHIEFAVRMYSLLEKSKTLKMDKETFVAGFPAYLKKKSGKDSADSLLAFLLQNPPSTK